MHRITETSNIMISAQAIFDAFPLEEVLENVRQEVANGVAQILTIEGMGAVIVGGTVDAFVTFDGEDHPVAFNVLRPAEALPAIGELLAALLVESAE